MSRRSTPLSSDDRDGTSQRGRSAPALDPDSAAIDERGHVDLLAFVRAFTEQLRFVTADAGPRAPGDDDTWRRFAARDDLSLADIAAYMADPARFSGDKARWLGRPHFALLLTFLELLGHARGLLNGLTRRHLEHYYRDVLQMLPEPPAPDRVAVVFRLAARAPQVRLPAGTALQAGRDSAGVPRIYRTEHDLQISRARVAALRSVFVHRRITGLADPRKDRNLAPREIFEQMLALALGDPRPGDPVPPWDGAPLDRDGVVALGPLLRFAPDHLRLEHHELRAMMQLVRRRADADHEWSEINRLLGDADPPDPRDFQANLEAVVGPLDFDADGLPQVRSLGDLYEHRDDPAVRAYLDSKFAAIPFADFVALMKIKRRIDADWAEVNRLLERVGRRQRDLLAWSLAPADPSDFAANLQAALGDAWPPPWPPGVPDLPAYDARLRQLEAHLATPAERLVRLVEFAEALPPRDSPKWPELERLLAEAHREKVHAARRAELAAARGGKLDLAGFDAEVAAALGHDAPQPWTDARAALERHLDRGQLDLLDYFRRQLIEPAVVRLFQWSDVDRVLELARRWITAAPEPVARRVEWRNLYALDDATAALADPASPRWKTFGRPPPAPSPARPPAVTLGFAVRSPLLALSQGTRTLTLTLALHDLDRAAFVRGLGLAAVDAHDPAKLRAALGDSLRVDVTGAKGWQELALVAAAVVAGGPGDDYFTLIGAPRLPDEDRPALQLVLRVDATEPPLIAAASDPAPTLRITLRQRWDAAAKEWHTRFTPFEPLVLAAVHLRVDVEGLTGLQLQHEDRALDPRKPFEPFGPRPAVGARLHLFHPELAGPRLDALRLDLAWMGLPASLAAHYENYPGITAAEDFRARLLLVDRGREALLADAALFEQSKDPPHLTARERQLAVADVPAALHAADATFAYERRPGAAAARDLRTAERHLVWELTPRDFGHAAYPALTSAAARDLAIGLSKGTIDPAQAADFAVALPYTPTLLRLAAAYRTSLVLDPARPLAGPDRLLHVHPFGEAPIDPAAPRLFPRYDTAGELYIGLADLDPPQQLALLLQLAEGTSDPDLEPAKVEWSALDGDRWVPLGGGLLRDSTRGLIGTGIVELTVPQTAPSTLLPRGLAWLRAAVDHGPASVCDTVAIRAQAVMLRFDDRGNAPDHYAQPLPVGSVTRLAEPDPRIAAIEQPYTSFGGRPPERPERFYTRVAERLRHRQRALAPWDYERLVLQRFPQIYKAKCLRGEPGRVDVVVIPDIRAQLPSDAFAPQAPADLLADIEAFLAAHAPAAATIRVRNARYVAVKVYLGVSFRPGHDERHARERLVDDLRRFLSPWAYDEGAELSIGGRIYANSILDFVDRRDYVDYVADLKLARSDDGQGFRLVPPGDDYHVATDRPDQVLVAARDHDITAVTELDYQQSLSTGVNFARIELDFLVS